tara:strand:+ start:2011 stop:2856 length:846 start_codon:yes stop_codon:yes gene_type:complete
MIIVADSGSSKCDWAYFDSKDKKVVSFETIGLNPYFIESEETVNYLKKNNFITGISNKTSTVFFYGAGCSESSKINKLKKILIRVFSKSKIVIEHDLLGACRSTYNNKTTINCIIGTGSIACLFDGKKCIPSVPSLGYILGDEGSGNYYGKKLLNLYFTDNLPKELKINFENENILKYDDLMQNIYQSNRPNFYLASFFPFIIKNKDHIFFKKMLKNGINEFLNIHVYSIPRFDDYKINFFGSVAYMLRNIITEELKKRSCLIGTFQKKPIIPLFNYHFKK